MFTSQAEHRLLLREDNADLRLMDFGRQFGLIPHDLYSRFVRKREQIDQELERLRNTTVRPNENIKRIVKKLRTAEISKPFTLAELLRRPEISYDDLAQLVPPADDLPDEVKDQVAIQIKYEGYIRREWAQVKHLKGLESRKIPPDFDYDSVRGITMEAREKLLKVRPFSVGQASRISGVSPADISVLLVMLEQERRKAGEQRA